MKCRSMSKATIRTAHQTRPLPALPLAGGNQRSRAGMPQATCLPRTGGESSWPWTCTNLRSPSAVFLPGSRSFRTRRDCCHSPSGSGRGSKTRHGRCRACSLTSWTAARLLTSRSNSAPRGQISRRRLSPTNAAGSNSGARARLAVEVGAEPVWVTADPERLELVLGNLLENAAKYTEPGSQVTVLVEATSTEVVLRVRNTGVGIAPDVLPFVFDPFVRERVPGVRPRRGSGVGLLLVRTLVELHGGLAEASSAGRGRGSEFVIRLPART